MSSTSDDNALARGGPLPALVAVFALGAIIVAAALVFAGSLALGAAKTWMLVGTVVWFVTAPVWLLRREGEGDA